MKEKFVSTLPPIFTSSKVPIYVLAPHPDDAVWSLGGLLRQLADMNYAITAITVFSHSAFAYDRLMAPAEATAIRKAENIVALDHAGVRHNICLDFAEGVLRDKSLEQIFDTNYRPSPQLLQLIGERIQRLISPPGIVLAPSAFGEHIDHLLVREVAANLPGRVVYYEDLPYAARPLRRAEAENFLRQNRCQEQAVSVGNSFILEHLRLYDDYISQRRTHHIAQIKEYMEQKGVRLWVR